jgi:spore germination protein GerM
VSRRTIVVALVTVALVGLASWAFVRFLYLPDSLRRPATKPVAAKAETPARRIVATLYYVAADGMRLVPMQREVLFGETPAQQARYLMDAQAEPAPDGLTNAIPPGVKVANVFVTDTGDAFVDFSAELRTQHPGGSLNEIFTVYTIVQTLTKNLPAVHAVQILVEGREVDTLAGHVDVRRPLPPAAQWLSLPESGAPPQAAPAR